MTHFQKKRPDMNYDVICIGQAVVDCLVRNASKDPDKPLNLVADGIEIGTGGDAVNESMALNELGVSAAPLIALGKDRAGDILRSALISRGISTELIRSMEPPFKTPVAVINIKADGSRSSISSKASLLPGFVPSEGQIPPSRVVSLASLFRAPFDDAEEIRRLVRRAKESGAIVCADTKLPTFKKVTLEDIREVLPLIDYIFPNEREAAHYSGGSTFEEMAAAFLDMGVKHVVIKAGPDGCFAADASGSFALPALPAEVVDTTGAGDHFVAGFIAALLKNESFEDCCRGGLACAAGSISRMGGA